MKKKITKVFLTSLITGISLQTYAAAQDNYNQKKTATNAVTEQHTPTTLLQAACRGALERQSTYQAASVQQPAHDIAATLIQAGVRGALTRREQRDALSDTQSTNTTWASQSNEDKESSENSESSENDKPLNLLLEQNTNDPQTTLLYAATNNLPWAIEGLIKRRADVNTASRQGGTFIHTPLLDAVQAGKADVVKTLINHKADVNAHDLLWAAINTNRADIVQLLIEAKTNVNEEYSKGCTPFIIANEKNYTEIEQLLIAANANVDVIGHHGHTPLIRAALEGQIEKTSMLIAARANLDATDNYSNTPLQVAADKGHVQIVQTLLDHKASVNPVNRGVYIPLIIALEAGQSGTAKMLIAAKADVNATPRYYESTPLQIASYKGLSDVVQMLINHKADIHATNTHGGTSLMYAIRDGHVDIVNMLLAAGAKIDINMVNKQCVLNNAIQDSNIELAQILIMAGANVNTPDQSFYTSLRDHTPLMQATHYGHYELIPMLIGYGADIDVATLMLPNFLEIIQSLLDSYRSQLAELYPEALMVISDLDLEQFNRSRTLQLMSDVFNQVAEVITRNMSDKDRKNLSAGCKLFKKAAINGKNIQSPAIKVKLFSHFITAIKTQLILLKEYTNDEEVIDRVENVSKFLNEALEQGYSTRQSDPACAVPARCTAPSQHNKFGNPYYTIAQRTAQILAPLEDEQALQEMLNRENAEFLALEQEILALGQRANEILALEQPITAQQAGPAAASENAQVACATLNAERAVRAQQETEYAQSLAIDQRRVALEKQIATLTTQAHAFMTEHDIHVAPIETRQQALTLFSNIIAARTELIELIQATQTFGQEIFVQANAAQLAKQNETCINEQAQLEIIKNAIYNYVPTREEIRAAREEYFNALDGNGRNGKNPA